ncbi:hypothetical protein ES703_57955 [subsurface metagenome]
MVILDCDPRQGSFQLLVAQSIVVSISGGSEGKLDWRWRWRFNERSHAPSCPQPGKAGVLQLFCSANQHYVVDTCRHSIGSISEGVGSSGAGIFHPGDGNILQLQSPGYHLPGRTSACCTIPACLDILGLDTSILDGLKTGIRYQIHTTLIPHLAKLGTPHANHSHSISDALHFFPPPFRFTFLLA